MATPDALDTATRLSRLRHDLRTPLNHIIGYAEMLEEDAPEELRPDLGRILSAAQRLVGGIDDALALVREVVESGAAPIPVLRAPTGPTEPSVTVAVAQAATAGATATPLGRVTASAARLLVVDDDALNRDVLARRLVRLGYTVECVDDGPAALARLRDGGVDLVLLDIMMPGMSGIEVLRRLREHESRADLPVIMATAKDGSADVVEALALGANDYVTKPINLPVVAARLQTQLELGRAHRFIRATFGRYLNDEVVATLLERPEGLALGGETRTVTILMSDLRGFSSLAGRLPPEQVIQLLNLHLGAMTEVIQRHGGTIDEFIGDAILVIFGAPRQHPDDALRAIACGVEMQRAMPAVNAAAAARGLPCLEMGVGINTGEVVVGNIGSERRAKYGVVGRTVNHASRIQAYAVGGQVLVSASSLAAAGKAVAIRGTVEVYPKGSRRAMQLHEVAGVGAPYDLQLDDQAGDLTPLAEPISIRFAILDGINAPAPHLGGHLTHLSSRAARVTAETAVAPMRALKLELWRDGTPVVGDLYGRVLTTEDEGLTLTLRFTSVSPGAAMAISELLATT